MDHLGENQVKTIFRKWLVATLAASFLVLDVGIIATPGQAVTTSIALEYGTGSYSTPGLVNLGTLASRTGSTLAVPKVLTKSTGSAPYTMTGTDGLSGNTYQFPTMQDYSTGGASQATSKLQEGIDVTGFQSSLGIATVQNNQATSGITGIANRSGVYKLTSSQNNIGTAGGNSSGGGFGTVFGPEIWSVPFEGVSGKSVSFDWAAANGNDDYEIYAFVVKISSASGSACTSATGTSSYGLTSPTSTHTLIAYGRGTKQDWNTSAGSIPSTGCYRFRFVSGSFDQTGGLALGASLYVDNTVIIGSTQTITFPQPNDRIRASSDITFSAGASTNATGATLTYVSTDTAKCTVASNGTITLKATGTCIITVGSGTYGDYAAAESVTRSFAIIAAAVAPTGQGTGRISGTGETCSNLTAVIGTWNDGGDTITATSYQWKIAATASGTYADISGATSSSYKTTTSDLSKYIKVLFTRTNGVGSGTELSASLLVATVGASCASTRIIKPGSLLTFMPNGADNFAYPQSPYLGETLPLWKNILIRTGYIFAGWNTKADGTGTAYADQASFTFSEAYMTLFAQWKLIQTKPTITWATPAAVQEGTPLGATQLNALASVPGTYTYSPAAPTVLTPGKYALNVTFVPTDAKYESIQATVEIEVLAKAKVTWANPAAIQEGTAQSSTQLNATASVPGTFSYSPASGTVPAPGKNTLKVTFTPTDSRLSPVTAEVILEVTAKPVVVELAPGAPVSPTYSVSDSAKTTIIWGAGKDAATYTVLVDGKSACSVALTTCEVGKLLGPKNVVTVTSVATNTKTSAAITASYVAPAESQVLSVVNFDTAKSVLNSSETAKLRAFAATVKSAGYTSLTVYGHTDSVGGVDNKKLSVARANSTIAYLKKILPGVSFVVSGFAASEPVGDNATNDGKAANRRAEIFIP
jgi:outer membrane protein OmpA-like peptidoglycan-associated protein